MELESEISTLPRMLVIEDNDAFRRRLCRIFAHEFEVIGVASIEAAKQSLTSNPFSVVISDLSLPESESEYSNNIHDSSQGLGLIAEIRRRDIYIPVIIITGYPSPENIRRALQLQVTDLIHKPLTDRSDEEKLRSTVHAAISRARQQQLQGVSAGLTYETAFKSVGDSILIDIIAAFLHKLNNELNEIGGIVEDIEDQFATISDAQGRRLFDSSAELKKCIKSVAYIIQRFGNALGRHPGVLKPMDVHAILSDVQMKFPGNLNSKIALRLTNSTYEVIGDYELLWHLFENLIRNALDAIQGRKDGLVTVTTAVDRAKQVICIHVHDNGRGIKPEHLNRIFDLNYSTNPKGLGIGLYLVRRACSIHGGAVEWKSDPTAGTEFKVSLPLRHKGTD